MSASTVCCFTGSSINELRLSLECEVVHTVTVGSHTQITGEVKNILAEEGILNENGRILLDRLNPLIYDEEQRQYLRLGGKVTDAFRPGAEWKRALKEDGHGQENRCCQRKPAQGLEHGHPGFRRRQRGGGSRSRH